MIYGLNAIPSEHMISDILTNAYSRITFPGNVTGFSFSSSHKVPDYTVHHNNHNENKSSLSTDPGSKTRTHTTQARQFICKIWWYRITAETRPVHF